MSKYAAMLDRRWATSAPSQHALIENPTAFFADLAKTAEAEIQQLQMSLAGQDPPGETYLEKVGRLNMARLQAEEAVLDQLAPAPEAQEARSPRSTW